MRRIAVVACVAVALGLTGCSSTPFGLAVFDKPQGDADVLPSGRVASDLDPDSVRWLVTDEGIDYYVALSAEAAPQQLCFAAMRHDDADSLFASCSTQVGFLGSAPWMGSVRLTADASGDEAPDGWHRIHPNLIVSD